MLAATRGAEQPPLAARLDHAIWRATKGAGQPPQPPFADPPTGPTVGSNEGSRAIPATATRRATQLPHPAGDEGGRAIPAAATRQPIHQADR